MKNFIFNLQRFANPIHNRSDYATINGTDSDDQIHNYASLTTIFAKAGNDTVQISNKAENSLIVLGDGNDYAHNSTNSHGVTIAGNAGNDTLENNSSKNVSIHGGAGNDVFEDLFAESTTIYGGAGADSITIGSYSDYRSDYDYVDGGAEDDYIQTNSGYGTLIGGAGNDYISLNSWANNTTIVYNEGDGNDTIKGFDSNDTLEVSTSNYSTVASDGDLLIQVGSGSIRFIDKATDTVNVTVISGREITNSDRNAAVNGSAANDTLTNYGASAKISADKGNDKIYSGNVENVIADGGEGHDTIQTIGQYTSINGGAGDDSISASHYHNTVIGGQGNDTLNLVNENYDFFVQYNSGDGDDLIYNFSSNDTLKIAGGNGETLKTENDIIVQVDSGYITLDGAASNNTFNLIYSATDENFLMKFNNHYNYTGGNKTIPSYSGGEKINFATDYRGIGFNTTDFMLNSSSGTLTVKDVHNKVLDIVTEEGGGTVAYVYWTTNDGKIDGSGISAFELVIGGDNLSNEILAGSGGSSLWGGVGGYDTLTGGNGIDNFFYGKSDGIDTINSASRYDTILLYDVNLSDIIGVSYDTNQINLNLFSGGKLQVNGTENLSAIFQLADGSKYKCDTNTQTWQNA